MADEPFDVVIPFELEVSTRRHSPPWSAVDGVVFDFAAQLEAGHLLVTSRVRISATASLEVRRAIDEAITDYELQYGEIHRPRPRGENETG